MACVNEPLVSAYLDGSLGPGELDVIVGHLESCPACLAEFHEIKSLRAMLRTMPLLDPPDELIQAVGVGPWDGPPTVITALHPGDQLSAYLDGELTTGELDVVTSHIATCTSCRAELQELDAARTAIRALPRLDPPALVVAAGEDVSVDEVAGHGPRRTLAGYVAGAAAAFVVAVALLGGSSDSPEVDIDRLVVHHNARQSVEAGFSVIPAIATESNR